MTSAPVDSVERKRLGAWYTPSAIIRPLVEWVLRGAQDHVLDPAVGDGDFLVEAAAWFASDGRRLAGGQLHGFDINPDAVAATKTHLAAVLAPGDAPDVRQSDFFSIDPPGGLFGAGLTVDAVVGNPPYVRYQTFKGASRENALSRVREAGAPMGSLVSSWAPFVVHAASFLRPGGRLAFVLPEELLHASYAEPVRLFLRRAFGVVSVIRFDGHLFPESQERVLLLLADGKGETPSGELRLVTVERPESIQNLAGAIETALVFPPDTEPGKWEKGHDDEGSAIVEELVRKGLFVELRDVGKAGIGYVSGANDYFVFRPSEVLARNFPDKLFVPTLIAARQAAGAVLGDRDWEALLGKDDRCLLWCGKGLEHRGVAAYVADGESRGIDKRYKCRVREPWYVVPGVVRPDAFLTYMSDHVPRLILNRIGATCSNNLLAVRLDDVPPRLRPVFVAAFYNSATLLSAERIGRRYGGGVLKLEPSEADRIVVPGSVLKAFAEKPETWLDTVDSLLRSRRYEELTAFMDKDVLGAVCGLSTNEIDAIRQSCARRRLARKQARMGSRTRLHSISTAE
jgi:SAM-dependent methyltransferase